MLNKCLNYHPEIHENHQNYNLDKNINEIFTGQCKEEKHKNELEFYCDKLIVNYVVQLLLVK